MNLVEVLEEKGIKLDDIENSAMELFVPHGSLENKNQASEAFKKILASALKDTNISALVLAGLLLDECGGKGAIPGLDIIDFKNDSVHIIADEILGMAIAEYIGGTKARFEYVRYDMKKPGILGELGPFTDDVICGLIAGASSQMYSEALK
ncbi:alpha-ribazole phosphatase CobZ [archaeon]|nr:alpha-ribazole phosphatase CobZ [archaeon]